MNPAEDTILFGDEITDGMLVLPENELWRVGTTEDQMLRAQRFCQVTRLRRQPGYGASAGKVIFIGEWVDGYQQVMEFAETYGWIVKKDSIPQGPPASE